MTNTTQLMPLMHALGLQEKEQKVYLTLLEKKLASVRTIAEKTGLGRGSVYTILKYLQELGLASVSKKGDLKYFAAEDPEKLVHTFETKEQEIKAAKGQFLAILPELKSLYGAEDGRPKVTYYTGLMGIKSVLEDILFTLSSHEEKMVRAYSSEELRSTIYEAFPAYTQLRIDKGIGTKVMKLGEGGYLRGLDEVRFLATDKPLRTYTHMYGNKVSYITSKSSGYILSVIIEDAHIANTQKFLFEQLWDVLPNPGALPQMEDDF